jgi:hypothetical protein
MPTEFTREIPFAAHAFADGECAGTEDIQSGVLGTRHPGTRHPECDATAVAKIRRFVVVDKFMRSSPFVC